MIKKLVNTFELIKFSHTIFALPFVLIAFFVATRGHFEFKTLSWVILCVLFARSAAMSFNRLIDAKYDVLNPRTKDRHLPKETLSKKYVIFVTIISSVLFIFFSSRLNNISFLLSPLCLGILFFYSLTKRWTYYTQIYLGVALGIAPIGATIAVTGALTVSSAVLGIAVLCWVAGFDLIYSTQDYQFDLSNSLYSIPVKIGLKRTFQLSLLFHIFFLVLLFLYGILADFKWFYWIGYLASASFIIWEHFFLSKTNIKAAFFTANGLLSLFFMMFALADIYLFSF